jgi:hypothetical protein
MKSRVFALMLFAAAVAVVALSFYGAKHATFHIKAYAQITATPFVAEVDFYDFRSNPQGSVFLKKVVARRSDGSTAEVTSKEPLWNVHMRNVTFMNGAALTAYDFVSSKTSFQMKPQELAAMKQRLTNSPVDCVYRSDARIVDRQMLFGQQIIVLEHIFDQPNQGDAERITEWFAPALGCEKVGYRYEVKQSGSYKLGTESRLISLEMKEPEPAFFDPAANFEEVLPSEAMRRHYEKIGQPVPAEIIKSGERADAYTKEHK